MDLSNIIKNIKTFYLKGKNQDSIALPKDEIKAVLDELGIKYLSNSSQVVLWALLPAPIANEIHRARTAKAEAEAEKVEREAGLAAEAKTKLELGSQTIDVSLTPREKAWEHFKNTMKKYDLKRFERMSVAGELDKIPEKFTY